MRSTSLWQREVCQTPIRIRHHSLLRLNSAVLSTNPPHPSRSRTRQHCCKISMQNSTRTVGMPVNCRPRLRSRFRKTAARGEKQFQPANPSVKCFAQWMTHSRKTDRQQEALTHAGFSRLPKTTTLSSQNSPSFSSFLIIRSSTILSTLSRRSGSLLPASRRTTFFRPSILG
jgi:hypothetical protein